MLILPTMFGLVMTKLYTFLWRFLGTLQTCVNILCHSSAWCWIPGPLRSQAWHRFCLRKLGLSMVYFKKYECEICTINLPKMCYCRVHYFHLCTGKSYCLKWIAHFVYIINHEANTVKCEANVRICLFRSYTIFKAGGIR